MNLLKKLTLKNLRLNKKRTVVTIIGIILSVALITAVASIYSSGIKSLINFETREKGDFHTVFYNVPVNDIETFENNRNIQTINITKNIGYAKIDSKNQYKPYAFIKAFTKDSLNNLSIKLVKGRLPENENEIIIPTHLKTNGRLFLDVNDTITLEVGKRISKSDGYTLNQNNPYQKEDNENQELIINTTKKTYKVVGIIERPASNIENYSAPGYTFITYINEDKLEGDIDIYAKFTKKGVKNSFETTANILGINPKLYKKVNSQGNASEEELKEYSNQINKAKYTTDINSYLIALETNPISNSGIGGLGVVVSIVIGIILFTSIFCIKNSFDISITEKIKQYGMLRSIGATKKQIKQNVFYEATILGLISIPLGIALGLLASFILIIISNYYLSELLSQGLKLEFSLSWLAIVVSVILGIITMYFSAFRSAKRASLISPIDSIKNSANIKINPKKIKAPKFIKYIFGIGGEISFKNIKRNKRKYRTTVISITISVFIFIALSQFMSLAFRQLDHELKISDFNISLSNYNMNTTLYEKFIQTTKFDGINDYTIFRSSTISFQGTHYNKEYMNFLGLEQNDKTENEMVIVAIGKEQFKKYIKSLNSDYETMKNKAVLIDSEHIVKYDKNNKKREKYIRQFDFNKGDSINSIVTSTNQYKNIEIGIISDKLPFGLSNSNITGLIISDELFDEIATTNDISIYYKAKDANKLQDQIDEYLGNEEYNIDNIDENVKIMSNLFTLIGIFLYGFIIVISLIGITNIFNTITTNMELRRQEFAMLKSIGMTMTEFNKMIRLESLFMGMKSLFLGIPIGLLLSYIIYHFLSEGSGITYKIPLLAIIIAIIAVFTLISLIMKYSINKINKQNTIETIRNENI